MIASYQDWTLAWATTPAHGNTVVLRRHGAWWADFDADETGASGTRLEDHEVSNIRPLRLAEPS